MSLWHGLVSISLLCSSFLHTREQEREQKRTARESEGARDVEEGGQGSRYRPVVLHGRRHGMVRKFMIQFGLVYLMDS